MDRYSMTTIYIGNLSSQVTEDEIRRIFARFGEVNRVSIVVDRETNRPRGFAFVEMPNERDAKAAIALMSRPALATST